MEVNRFGNQASRDDDTRDQQEPVSKSACKRGSRPDQPPKTARQSRFDLSRGDEAAPGGQRSRLLAHGGDAKPRRLKISRDAVRRMLDTMGAESKIDNHRFSEPAEEGNSSQERFEKIAEIRLRIAHGFYDDKTNFAAFADKMIKYYGV